MWSPNLLHYTIGGLLLSKDFYSTASSGGLFSLKLQEKSEAAARIVLEYNELVDFSDFDKQPLASPRIPFYNKKEHLESHMNVGVNSRSEKELRTAIDNYMLFYNEKRPHAKNGYKTPSKKEAEYQERQK